MSEEKLWDKVNILLKAHGQEALQFSKDYVLQEKIEYEPLGQALGYFFESWFDVLHPTLISLSCEAVGGKKELTIKASAAIVLLAGAADIHDDIMDRSITKGADKTVFGKYGVDIAILAGDALLLKGVYLLNEACDSLSTDKKHEVLQLIKNTFFEMSSGVAMEASLRGKTELSPDYMKMIRQKVATAGAATHIGAILGNGSKQETEAMDNFGRIYGILLSLRDEFVDVFEADEIKNRMVNERLPLPILLALQDKNSGKQLAVALKNELTPENVEKIVEISLDCSASRELVGQMRNMVEKEISVLPFEIKEREIFSLLLKSTIEDI
jgi:geranylgeranyl pyrophosphate synthase